MISTFQPLISKSETELLDKISNSKKRRQSLFLLYSEFWHRAKENSDYRMTLENADYLGVDGKGVVWALNTIEHFEMKVKEDLATKPKDTFLSYCVAYIGNLFSAWNFIFLQKGTRTNSGINLILGRNLTYSLLNLAQTKNWKILLVGGGEMNLVKNNIIKKYNNIKIDTVSFDSKSVVMIDGLNFDKLNNSNLFEVFPELILTTTKVLEFKPDLILVGLGGTSGKQEFLIEELTKEEEIDFGLAVGIGAALDHLGGGKKQKEAPQWMQKVGLEFVWRIINQPYRIKRILDSVFGLIQLVTDETLKSKKP